MLDRPIRDVESARLSVLRQSSASANADASQEENRH
jgi:hypothetical protein